MFKSFFKKIGNFFGGIGDAIGDIIGGIGDAIGGIISGAVKLVTNIVDGFLGAFGFSFDLPEYDSPSAFQNENQGILVNTQSAVRGIPVIYGERRVGGTRVYMATGGDNNKYLYVILAVAEGEIDGYTKVFINDEEQEVLDAGNTARGFNNKITQEKDLTLSPKTPSGEDSTYYRDGKSLAVLTFYTGRENQSANGMFVNSAPGWTSNSQLRGIAYVACRFEYVTTGANPWQGIPEVKVQVRGKKVLTTYSSKDTDTDTSTYESDIGAMVYSQNPAACLLDYLRNPRYGKGLKDNRINFTSFFNLQQDVFDNTAVLATTPDTVITHLVKCDAVLNTEDTLFNNTKRLLQSCRGFLPYVNGKYKLKFEGSYDAGTSQFTGENPVETIEITDDMIIGDISIQSEDKNAKYNEAQVTFANEEKDYDSDTVIYQDASYITSDGEPLVLTTSHPTLTNYYRVQQYAKYLVDRSRNQLAVSIKVTNEGQSIVAGDLVRITHQYKTTTTGTDLTDYLFKAPTTTSKTASLSSPEMLFRVVSTKLNYDNTVDLQLMEHRNEIFTVAAITVDQPPQCGPNYTLVDGECVYNGGGSDPVCPTGQVYDPNKQNADGTIGGCVDENPNQCGEGYVYDPTANNGLGGCVLAPINQKVVKVTTFVNSGIGNVEWIVDGSTLPDANIGFITIVYSFYKNNYQMYQKVGLTGNNSTLTFRTNSIPEGSTSGFIPPGATIYYKVFQQFGTLTASPAIRLDQANPGDDNGQFNAIGVPTGDGTIVQAASVGGGTQGNSSPGGVPVNVDDVLNTTSQEGFE